MAVKSIGIIGGGVSGLAVAYEIRRNAIANKDSCKIDIFEKHPVIGGNADTVVVNLGNRRENSEFSTTYQRWADMGVNDINLTAYKRIEKIMKEIGYFDRDDPELNKTMLPLENTETYFTWDNDVLLTDDQELKQGVSNPLFTLESKDNGEFVYWIGIVHQAADGAVGCGESMNIDISVKQFFDGIIAEPKKHLEQYTGSKKIDWDSPELKRILREIRDHIFYPRISAMYFANDDGPEDMCLAAPMGYYRIQESKDEGDADRRYFVGGASRWLKALLDNLLDKKHGQGLVEIELHRDFPACACVAPDHVLITHAGNPEQRIKVNTCVVTVHADDAVELLKFEDATSRSEDEEKVMQILKSISYTHSIAVCHSYSGMMPANRNQWRAYNVLIRKDVKLKPYNMTYLCNRHQNDSGTHQSERYNYNQMGLPQYFVTLNPQREIPERYILPSVDPAEVSAELRGDLAQLEPDVDGQPRHGRIPAGKPATTQFKHNLIDKKCFLAQKDLTQYHQSAKNLFFAGGWSHGSGLHEECWHQAEDVANWIVRPKN